MPSVVDLVVPAMLAKVAGNLRFTPTDPTLLKFKAFRRQQEIKFSRDMHRNRFNRQDMPVLFVENGESQDEDKVFGGGNPLNYIVMRRHQFFVTCGMLEDQLSKTSFTSIRDMEEELISMFRIIVFNDAGEEAPQVWDNIIRPVSPYDMSPLDPQYLWCKIEVWYKTIEPSNYGS